MKNEFTKVMLKRTDAELLMIVNKQRNDYQPAAVAAGKLEIKSRKLITEKINESKHEEQ